MLKSLAVTVCATKNYCYAMKTLGRRVQANLYAADRYKFEKIYFIVAGDDSKECKESVSYWSHLFGKDNVFHLNVVKEDETAKNYKETAQLTIAKMREAAFSFARQQNVDYCWSLDSDTLPPSNALRCMLDTLQFDNGFYSIACCPYPNTAFLGGYGTYQNPIAEDFLPSERKIPDELKAEVEKNDNELKEFIENRKNPSDEPTEDMKKRWEETSKKIKECPPDGDIWDVTAKYGWRRRGWADNAFPGLSGSGACVKIDWHGFGCTLMNKEALSLASFHGYEGRGTEDLWVWWSYWNPSGLNTCNVLHCLCDHVIATRKKDGNKENNKLEHIISYHEREGEYRGHLRTKKVQWLYD